MERLRITYTKAEALRYTSNLDVHKIWERLLRRARLPLAYSQGFHPQPRINQAAPLPLGFTSQVEMVDFWLEKDLPLEDVKMALVKSAPPGLEIKEIALVDPHSPSLPTVVRDARYRVILLEPSDEVLLQAKIAELLAAPESIRERRGRTYDLRPLIREITLESNGDGRVTLWMTLSASESATGRPDEVLLALDVDPFAARIERVELTLVT